MSGNKMEEKEPGHPFLFGVAAISHLLDLRRESRRRERFLVRRNNRAPKAFVPSEDNLVLDRWVRENPRNF